VRIEKSVDLKTALLDQNRLRDLATKMGGIGALFSKRSLKFRSMGFKDKRLADKDLVDLMASEYTFIKRPVIELKTRAVAGFNLKAYGELLDL
jgi:arsenate reductase-like glutaredoxin family protein